MKIYNQEKTQILCNPNLNTGHLIDDKILTGYTPELPEIKEKSHLELVQTFPKTKGKEFKKVIDVPCRPFTPSEPIYEDIQIYIPNPPTVAPVQPTEQIQDTDTPIPEGIKEWIKKQIEAGAWKI
jgi:hypothetical protein